MVRLVQLSADGRSFDMPIYDKARNAFFKRIYVKRSGPK
jgi:hypothetical protein